MIPTGAIQGITFNHNGFFSFFQLHFSNSESYSLDLVSYQTRLLAVISGLAVGIIVTATTTVSSCT